VSDGTKDGWYAVRCVIDTAQASDGEGRAFEERITLWRAASFDEAIERAGIEAAEYASSLSGASATELLQAYRLPAEPSDGAEIFSLIRMSQLRPDPYLSAFFDTGTELQQT
jgi:hypothetical protein